MDIIKEAWQIAKTYDVTTVKDGAVVYSISYMPNQTNKEKAMQYIKENPNAKTLDDTLCGKALTALGLNASVDKAAEEITQIWKLASKRFIHNALGNIIAFVDNADERSTFYTTELKEILENQNITDINDTAKEEFALNFIPKHYDN